MGSFATLSWLSIIGPTQVQVKEKKSSPSEATKNLQPSLIHHHFLSNTWPALFTGCLWNSKSWIIKSTSKTMLDTFSSVTQSCPTLCDPMDCSTPSLPVYHQLLELIQTHVHQVDDAIQLSHPLSSPSPAFNLFQHQGLFKWVSSSHQVAKVLEF